MDIKNIGAKNKLIAILFSAFIGIAFFSSCKKEDPTVVTISVEDTLRMPASGVFVRLYAKPSDSTRAISEVRFDETKITDGSGQVKYDFTEFTKPGQAGFAVLDILAYQLDPITEDTLTYGIGQVRVEEEKNNQQTVRVQ